VEPLYFVRPVYRQEPSRWQYPAAFLAYRLLAGRKQHRWYRAKETLRYAPALARDGLLGSYGYMEAAVDDARLVLRLVLEGVRGGGRALSYGAVESLLRASGRVQGVAARDRESGRTLEIPARAVVNATGTRVDELRRQVDGAPRIRPLRGSHLVFAPDRLPMDQALSFRHPRDGRHLFGCSWEGATMVGTTDQDHREPLAEPPRTSADEVGYLMEAVRAYFPALQLDTRDILATWAGVRPVVGTERTDPSAESREAMLVEEQGLVSVTGGKLTTARTTALATLARLQARLPAAASVPRDAPFLDPPDPRAAEHPALDSALRRRLAGRYGREAGAVVAGAREGELRLVPGTHTLWAELRHAARAEGVTHLEDLMLRRTRIGMVRPEGGAGLLDAVRAVVQAELGWSDEVWAAEARAYRALWRARYACPTSG
jgi:glycerol-3-phosphate dehydrogenase